MKTAIAFMILLVASAAYAIHYDRTNPIVCVEKSKVKEILALQYRDGVIRLEDGRVITVNQMTLKPGDTLCVKYDRKYN